MCSSECDRVSNLMQDLGESSMESNRSNTLPQHRHSMNSTSTSSRPLFSLYVCLLCIVLCFSISSVDSAAIVKRRAISAENTSQQSSESSDGKSTVCHSNTPCGWAVYIPVSRRVDYYMKNVCVCPEGKECLKSEDDVSVNAYVYRCKKKSPTKDD